MTSALGFRPVCGSIESTDDEGAIVEALRVKLLPEEEKAIALPSGAHAGAPAPRGISVTARGSPPLIGIT